MRRIKLAPTFSFFTIPLLYIVRKKGVGLIYLIQLVPQDHLKEINYLQARATTLVKNLISDYVTMKLSD
jgi:hypothetical protein